MKKLFAATLIAAMPLLGAAQTFPSKPITIIVPNPPGGLVDSSARLLSEPLAKVLGTQVVVDNRGGGSGNIAYGMAAKAAPDG